MSKMNSAIIKICGAALLLFGWCALSPFSAKAQTATPTPEVVGAASVSEAPKAEPPSTLAPPPKQAPAGEERLAFMSEMKESADAEPAGGGRLFVRATAALLLLLGLVVAAGWGLRRFGGARFGAVAAANAPPLSLLSTIALGGNCSLAVVRFGAQTMLVGKTPQAITLLSIDADEARARDDAPPARSVADLLAGGGNAPSFAEALSEAGCQLEATN